MLNDHVIIYKFMTILSHFYCAEAEFSCIFLPVKYLDLYFCSSHVYCKNMIFIVHSKKSNNHENKNETMKLKRNYYV